MVGAVSFRRHADAEGWRWSISGYRTRRVARSWWPVERWSGEDWEIVDTATSYADARRVATADAKRRREES